jgi:hypothetical protein
MYNQEGFDHRIHEQVDVGAGASKVHALLTPYEAELLLELLSDTKVDFSEREVNPESLEYRLGLAATGQQAPQSGQPEYYK